MKAAGRGVGILVLACSTAWSPGACGAAEPAPRARVSPRTSMLLSAVIPGWGQAANGHPVKGAVQFAAGAGLVGKWFIESRRADRSLRMAKASTSNAEYLAHYDDYARHFNRREDVVWWAAFFWLYTMVDAYVDAHLAGFDDTFENEPTGDRIRPWIDATETGVRFGIRVGLE